ncbi:BTB/POZ domain-containing protein At1g04390 isoform X2 [Alnus glutinosa]|uniref:BTB/POZ domain-containing protein At1g04390 isoform X2 n=1 Tax=Alnus glutinosa TaxID=3517 RepID=UPI002D787E73|nr:BTB/POZ domain-containing protein At1g04390 isoform X2 [Alnus glutinosa]
MRSSKHRASENNRRSISGQMYTLHQRLYHALNLGTRFYDDNTRKWQSMDIEIQRHVVRSIAAFLDSISGDTIHHPLVKDSVSDMVGALVGILQYRNGSMLNIAANVVEKLVNILPNSIVQPYVLDLVYPLSKSLSLNQGNIAISCVIALNLVLLNLNSKSEKAIWEILKETKTVAHIVSNIQDTSGGMVPSEHFQEMASLLSTILWRWPPSRYPVWTDAKLMKTLEAIFARPDLSVKVAVLKLYSALALCGSGAKNLIDNGEAFLQITVQCMGRSHPYSVQVEGFRLAQCLVRNEENCLKLLNLFGEPVVNAIVSEMCKQNSLSGKAANDQVSLLKEACRLALITRWAGKHHIYFWKQGIDRVLLGLLLEDFHDNLYQHFLSLEELMSIAHKVLSSNYLLVLRGYIWDILGWLATHCGEDFNPNTHGNELHLNILITCSCLVFVDVIRKWCQICQNDVVDAFKSEPASRAVLMMIFSPCKYIASRARLTLFEILKPNGKEYLKHVLHTLSYTASGSNLGMPNVLKIVINLIGLTCYSGLPQYQRNVIKGEGIKTLLVLVKWCLENDVHIGRLSFAPHLHNTFHERCCCWVSTEDWEGKDIPLLYSLWVLAELMHNSGSARNILDIFAGEMAYTEAELVSKLQEICINTSTPGLRWFAAYVLSYFGAYGFPSKIGKRIGKGLNEKEYVDMHLILTNGDSLSVHGVVLAVQCPSLLPSKELYLDENTFDGSSVRDFTRKSFGEVRKEIRLSAHVDHQALLKLLEYVYWGYLQAGEELVKKLKTLAKRCNVQPLLQLLSRKSPKWGTPFPYSDLSLALGPAGLPFSDIILEAKATELMCWTCSFCSLSVPHMHVHKVILWSSCDYMQALFQSGMQDSHSQTIKVPVSWEALVKLVDWFYSNKLPNPPSGCLWDNMDTKEKLCELHPYVELCWLAEFWLLEDVKEACSHVIGSCLDSARHLSIKIIQIAANFSLWKLAEIAASYMAPSYRQLCDSGELEALDEMLVDMVRAASVRLSQEGGSNSR